MTIKRITVREAWSGAADCLDCDLRHSALFAGLGEDAFACIHDPIDQFSLRTGATLYAAGAAADHLFTVRSGTLKLVRYLPDGTQRIVRVARATHTLGLEAMLEGGGYQHHAVALEPVAVCRFPARLVRDLGQCAPDLYRELMTRWQRALTEADAWLTELSTGSARQRVARLLLRLAREHDPGACPLFGREDMGAMLGVTTETASRAIAEFRRQGLLTESEAAPGCFALDLPGLRASAGE